MPGSVITLKARAFLAAYRVTGRITSAAEAAGITREHHYGWLRTSPAYCEAFERAWEEKGDLLEEESFIAATEGYFEPNVWQGRFIYPQIWDADKLNPATGETGMWVDEPGAKPFGVYRKSSADRLFLLRGMKPEKYRDRVSAELTGKDGGPIETVSITEVLRDRRARREAAEETKT